MSAEIQKKMQDLMYALTKHAARDSYSDFLKFWDISDEDYDEIKRIWRLQLGVTPYV